MDNRHHQYFASLHIIYSLQKSSSKTSRTIHVCIVIIFFLAASCCYSETRRNCFSGRLELIVKIQAKSETKYRENNNKRTEEKITISVKIIIAFRQRDDLLYTNGDFLSPIRFNILENTCTRILTTLGHC